MFVSENFCLVQSEFGVQRMTKFFVTDNHYEIICEQESPPA